jgi:membrane protein
MERWRFPLSASSLPSEIRLLPRALGKFNRDHAFLLSSGIAFALLGCLIPLILLALALVGTYLLDHEELLEHISEYVVSMFPALDPKITENLLSIMRNRNIFGILGLAGLLWTSTWVFTSLRGALNIIFGVPKGRSVLRGKIVDLSMILLAGTFLLLSMAFTWALGLIQQYPIRLPLDLGPFFSFLLKYVLPFLFTFWMFFLIYKIAPNKRIPFQIAFKTAFFTSLSWEVAKQLFGWYVLHLGRFSAVYGSLGTGAIFFFWTYYSAAILLFGGEMAALLEEEQKNHNHSE